MQEFLTKAAICLLAAAAAGYIGACGERADDPPGAAPPVIVSLDDSLQEIASETGLAIIDLSVPFERFADAPDRLRRIADALAIESVGLYVLRYSDDTLRQTQHIFVIRRETQTYIKLTAIAFEELTRIESAISSAEYDEATNTLTLRTDAGEVRLTPTDITSVGA